MMLSAMFVMSMRNSVMQTCGFKKLLSQIIMKSPSFNMQARKSEKPFPNNKKPLPEFMKMLPDVMMMSTS